MTMVAPSGPAPSGKAPQRLPGRVPLRVKLISALLALVAVALVVISITGISVVRSYLLGQSNQQLSELTGRFGQAQPDMQAYLQNPGVRYQPGVSVAWIPSDSALQQVVQPEVVTGFGPAARSTTIPGPTMHPSAQWFAANADHPITVPAQSGDGRWRVIALSFTVSNLNGSRVDGIVIVGVDVSDVYATIGRLTSIDLIVSTVILLVLALVGVALVRASLRPLTEIERTAEGIAAGDLTRRIPDRDPRTEVGRLGRSLNAMLAQIETAFHARAASEAAARRSEERIRQFVADASHELRTPLTAIRGFAEYYRQRGGLANGRPDSSGPETSGPGGSTVSAGRQDGPDRGLPAADPAAAAPARGGGPLTRVELDRIMRRVEQESSRMGVLVEDMLLLARLDQQRPLEKRPVDLLTLAADAVHDARVIAPQRSIDLTVSAGAALIVLGDEVRLRQVIGNLMSNALTHTPDGTPVEVRIRSGTLDEGGAKAGEVSLPPPGPGAETSTSPPAVILEVADRGPGLTPEQAERAFERFYRADQARARQAGGSGLGLAIVAALVVAHGGRVSVEPTPGSGATFRIALPLAPEALAPETLGPEATGPGPAGQPDEEPPAGPGPAAG
jgi:two-component system, OmpR family, sensor kinase